MARRERSDFTQIESLNKTMQKEAKPLLEDRNRIQDVKALLAIDSPEADQQVRQSLVAVLGNFKGRATNLYYKDNKYFGNIANRLTGLAARFTSGRLASDDRTDLHKMLNDLETKLIDPTLTNIEANMKDHAKGYGLDTKQVELSGDFNRIEPKAASSPATSTYTLNGKTYTLNKEGKWITQGSK